MQQRLIESFLPIIYLHYNEQYLPCTPEWYIENSALCDVEDREVVKVGDLTSENLYALSSLRGKPEKQYLRFDGPVTGQNLNVPYLVRFRDDDPRYYDICVMFFFAYNGAYKILGGLMEKGGHYADLEHVTLRVDRQTLKLESVYFSAHARPEGMWVDAKDVEFEDGRPVVYAALGSHAMYPRADRWWRIAGFANDITDKGFKWDPRNYDLLTEQTSWCKYRGYFGAKDDVRSPRYQSFWDGELMFSSNVWSRMFGFINTEWCIMNCTKSYE
jgi:hypothetical protein